MVVASQPYVVDVVVGEVERSEGGGGRDQAQVGDRVVGQVQVLLKIKIFEWLGVHRLEIQTNFPRFRRFGSNESFKFPVTI